MLQAEKTYGGGEMTGISRKTYIVLVSTRERFYMVLV
jgi:hypothetical protein